jgi:tetratricopeptide (TPR) repeat protein
MGFRFWRRVGIMPGVTLNLSKSGGSLSFGGRGAKFTIGPRGTRATVGIPGTGLFYTTTSSKGRPGRKRSASTSAPPLPPAPAAPTARPEDRLTLGFFKRLVTPDDEEALVDGCRELVLGNEDKALEHFERAAHLADGAYLAGFLALRKGRLEEAARHLQAAAENHGRLGACLSKYGVSATMSLAVTDEVSAHVAPDLRGVLLGLVEVYQRQQLWEDAMVCAEKLQQLEPGDVLVRLSLAELLLTARPGDKEACRKVVNLAAGIEDETPVHAALLIYKAKALRALGLANAALETLTAALRRGQGRSKELLQALRYERALAYEDLGRRRQARSEFEKLYAEDPNYEDVAARLGL